MPSSWTPSSAPERQDHAGHDFNDFEVGKRHGLPMINIFTLDAKVNDAGGQFAGLDGSKHALLQGRHRRAYPLPCAAT